MTGLPEPMTPAKRKSLSPKIRFEVFKRDKFTCQYCGEAAPSVVLQCDHIRPVADGGANDILNLITACTACNSGKGARLLSDDAEIGKQIAQMAELEERRQQLEMLMQWRNELRSAEGTAVDQIASIFAIGGISCNENGKAHIRKWLRLFSVEEIIKAADRALDVYGEWDDDKIIPESWDKAFSKVPGIIRIDRQEAERPYLRRLFYIQGILKNRWRRKRLDWIDYLIHLAECGACLDEMEIRARRSDAPSDFDGSYDEWLAQLGRPF